MLDAVFVKRSVRIVMWISTLRPLACLKTAQPLISHPKSAVRLWGCWFAMRAVFPARKGRQGADHINSTNPSLKKTASSIAPVMKPVGKSPNDVMEVQPVTSSPSKRRPENPLLTKAELIAGFHAIGERALPP